MNRLPSRPGRGPSSINVEKGAAQMYEINTVWNDGTKHKYMTENLRSVQRFPTKMAARLERDIFIEAKRLYGCPGQLRSTRIVKVKA